MNDTDLSKNVETLFEREISNYRYFYMKYLLVHSNKRTQMLSELGLLFTKLEAIVQTPSLANTTKYSSTIPEIEKFISTYFNEELLDRFNEKPKYKSNFEIGDEDGFWKSFGKILMSSFEERKHTNLSRLNFITFVKKCLENYGLHPYIHQRDPRIFKRYNIIIVYKEERVKYVSARSLISQSKLEEEYLGPYYKNKPIILNGTIVPAKNIVEIKITSTLLWNDDEFVLFCAMKDLKWDTWKTDTVQFSRKCIDETNVLLINPHAVKVQPSFKNNSLTFISQTRIDELKKLNSSKFDLSRLVSFCEELNLNSTNNAVFSVVNLQRTIINYVPSIFGYSSFGQLLAQYPFPKSVKKSLDNLNNSMKNIADYHNHVQASETDSLPTMTQVDFSNDLDVLLSEVCKKLKTPVVRRRSNK